MLEMLWALLVVVVLAAVTATTLVPWEQLLRLSQSLMLGSAAIGVPLEIIYYAALGYLLGRGRERPKGWQWRSFVYHKELTTTGKWIVLPFFFVGALAFMVSALGILIAIIAFVAAVRQN